VPTKIGEFLASGRPVVVNPGLIDVVDLLEHHGCGVVYGSSSSSGEGEVVDQLESVLVDPGVPERCRLLAESHFDLDRGVEGLLEIYELVGRKR
jgi:glycosyltransferase involved in cell wall biosynthesis